MRRPTLLITMGDVAGIGPEIIVRGWPELVRIGRSIVVGDAAWLRRAVALTGSTASVVEVGEASEAHPDEWSIPCLRCETADLSRVEPGRVSGSCGLAAYDYLCRAIDLTMARMADAVVTAPLHKGGLHAAGIRHPGHTEILAERTGVRSFGMVLYGAGVAVVHATLHMALREVMDHLSTPVIEEKIRLIDGFVRGLGSTRPRIGVAALNPHAGDGGLFGDEEQRHIRPAVEAMRSVGIDVRGPIAADTLFVRAFQNEFDGIVAMYHDQGHIALKLTGWKGLVNISVGLPIIRTSVAHGTAYDIAWKGTADPRSLIAAAEVAARLVRNRHTQEV